MPIIVSHFNSSSLLSYSVNQHLNQLKLETFTWMTLNIPSAISFRSISHGLTALIAFDRCRIIRAPFKARAVASSARRTVQLMILRFDFI